MVRSINIIYPILGTTPETCYHFIKEPALCRVGEHMLTQATFTVWGLGEQFLLATGIGANPGTPIKTTETFYNCLYRLTFTLIEREFGHTSSLLCLQCQRLLLEHTGIYLRLWQFGENLIAGETLQRGEGTFLQLSCCDGWTHCGCNGNTFQRWKFK